MRRGDGLISHADLEGYRAVERPVLTSQYRDHRLLMMGPPASGGIALGQALRAVEPYPLAQWGFQSPQAVHLTAEALRRAFADRAFWLGDPDFVDVPARALLDPGYVRRRMATFDPDRTTPSRAVAHGTPPSLPREGTETTHYSVVDGDGMAVATTVTLNDYFGSKVVVDGAGFFLNDEMDDFTTAPGQPNGWGLIQGEANAVEPGKRMVSSMTPVIIEDPRGRLFMVAGSPGGARIISTVFQAVTNVIDFGMNAQQAVALPRFHHQWEPDELEHEGGLPSATLDGLRQRGWSLDRLTRFGAANVIVVRYDDGGVRTLEGGADPRRDDDDARGFEGEANLLRRTPRSDGARRGHPGGKAQPGVGRPVHVGRRLGRLAEPVRQRDVDRRPATHTPCPSTFLASTRSSSTSTARCPTPTTTW